MDYEKLYTKNSCFEKIFFKKIKFRWIIKKYILKNPYFEKILFKKSINIEFIKKNL